MPSTPGLYQRAGDLTWEPSRLPGLEWAGANTLLSCFSGPRGPLLPASPDLPGLPPTPPMTQMAWRGLWRAGDWPASSAGSLGPSGWGNCPLLLYCSPQPPSCAPRTTMRYQLIPVRMAIIILNQEITSVGKDVEKREQTFVYCWW